MRKSIVGIALLGIFMGTTAGLVAAATYTVTSTADTTDPGTLRTAINTANGNSGTDTIQINAGPIAAASSLPSITDPVIIEGNGATITASGNYVLFTLASGSSGSQIRQLVLINTTASGTAIRVESDNNVIQTCRVGLDWINTPSQGFSYGMHLLGQGNLVGGNGLSGQGNLVSRNGDGIRLEGSNNTVCGNLIGLSSDQTTDQGNNNGIMIRLSMGNRIGLPVAGWGNVICGNDNYGLGTYRDQGTVIQNNSVGLNLSGTAIPNDQGIYLWQAGGAQVGGDSNALQGNVVSSNSQSGIYLSETSSGNTVCGNIVGLTADQTQPRSNNISGIRVSGSGNAIGLPISGWGNVVSGNSNYGIWVLQARGAKVRNNLVGLNAAGASLSNGYGIYVWGSGGNQIGGNSSSTEGNCVSGNSNGGITLSGASTGNTICGNVVGLTPNQALARSNGLTGIHSEQVSGNRIGLPIAGWGNVISGNDNYGIYLNDAVGEKVQNNIIGLNASENAMSNGYGIQIWAGAGNLIGGNSQTREGNLISGNQSYGVSIVNSQGNSVCGNILGLNAAQTQARTNTGTSIALGNAQGTYIGRPISGWGNVIAGGSDYGISMQNSNNTLIQNNLIGLNSAGLAFGNDYGIRAQDSNNIQIGGVANAGRYESNTISDNGTAIYLVASANNTISGNFINTDLTGSTQVVDSAETLTMDLWGCYGNLIGGLNTDANRRANVVCGRVEGIRFRGASGGNTLTGNFIGVLANGSLPAQPYTTSVNLTDSSHDNLIGENNGQGNLVAGTGTGVVINGAATVNNTVWGNTIAAFSSKGISLEAGGNNSKAAPVVAAADGLVVQGSGVAAGDRVEVFLAESRPGSAGGSLRFLGAVTANAAATPVWSLNVLTVNGEYVCATSSEGKNTSEFSLNVISTGPTATPTATFTATPLATATLTPTPARAATAGRRMIAVPNPGRGQITFRIDQAPSQRLVVQVYNLNGERVATLQGETNASQVVWDCQGLAPGIYLARIWVDGQDWGKLKVAVLK